MTCKKILVLAVLVAAVALTFSGCGDVFRPSPSELAASVEMADNPQVAEISLSFVNDEVIFAYASRVLFQGETSQWDGEARVLYDLTTFAQECKSCTTVNGSWKAWRGTYAKSDNISPASQITQWLALAADGRGELHETPVKASEVSTAFPEACGEVYLLSIDKVSVDWRGLCDAHIDMLFGGAKLLETAGDCKVTLLFQRDTRQLVGIFLSAMEGKTALEGAIVISQTSVIPEVDDFAPASYREEAPLGEEWEILTN